MKAFLDAGGEKKTTKRKAEKSAKPKKDPDAPKKPAGGAFGCFLAKNRAAFTEECKGQPVTAVTKLASERWKKLSEDKKKVFQKEYEAKKAEYEEAKKSYVPPLPSVTNEEAEQPVARLFIVSGFVCHPFLFAVLKNPEIAGPRPRRRGQRLLTRRPPKSRPRKTASQPPRLRPRRQGRVKPNGGFRNSGYLGSLFIRQSYYLGTILGGVPFS